MKRLIIFLILLAIPAYAQDVQLARLSPAIVGGGVPAAGTDYSDITLFWRCEAAQMGAGDKYDSADSLWAASGGVINTDAVKTGTNGCDFAAASHTFSLDDDGTIFASASQGRMAFWVRINAWRDGGGLVLADITDSNLVAIQNHASTDGELHAYWRGGGDWANCYSTGAGLDDTNWHFVEFAWDSVANTMKIWVDNVERGSSTDAMTNWDNSAGVVTIGDSNAVSGNDIHMDLFMVSSNPTQSLYGLRDNTSAP